MNSTSSTEAEVDQSYERLIDLTKEMNISWISFQAQVAKGQLSEYDIKRNTLMFSDNLRVLLEATGQKSGIISLERGRGQDSTKLIDQVLEFVDAAERGDHVWNQAESKLYGVTLMHYFTSRGLHGIENNVSPEDAQEHITKALELANRAAYKLNHPNATESEIESVTSTLSKHSQPARKATRDQIVSVLKETAPDKGTRDLAIHSGFTDSEYSRMIDEARPITDIAGATGEGVAAFGEVNLAGEQEFSDEYVKSELDKMFFPDDQIDPDESKVSAESDPAREAHEKLERTAQNIADIIMLPVRYPKTVEEGVGVVTQEIGSMISGAVTDLMTPVQTPFFITKKTSRDRWKHEDIQSKYGFSGFSTSSYFGIEGLEKFIDDSANSVRLIGGMVAQKVKEGEELVGMVGQKLEESDDSVTDKPSLWWPENLRTEEERGLDIENIPEAERRRRRQGVSESCGEEFLPLSLKSSLRLLILQILL